MEMRHITSDISGVNTCLATCLYSIRLDRFRGRFPGTGFTRVGRIRVRGSGNRGVGGGFIGNTELGCCPPCFGPFAYAQGYMGPGISGAACGLTGRGTDSTGLAFAGAIYLGSARGSFRGAVRARCCGAGEG